MAEVMAVSFERYGRLYYLDPDGRHYAVGDRVLVPTEGGTEVAECVWSPEQVIDDDAFGSLPVCAGPAGEDDLERDLRNKRRRAEAKLVAKKLIKKHELPMKVVGIDLLDRSTEFDQMAVIYFTAPQRVDFRALVTDLARSLQARIDLRQVGSRDAARLTGGIGSCGRDLCCATFLKDFEPVSMRMAKVQDLPPNPLKISGACGRLMCCLKYEHPLYAEFSRDAPRIGTAVETPAGDGVVVGHRAAADAVVVRMNDSGATMSCSRAGVCGSRAAFTSRTTLAEPVEAQALAEPVEAQALAEPVEAQAPAEPVEAQPSAEPVEGRKRRHRQRRKD